MKKRFLKALSLLLCLFLLLSMALSCGSITDGDEDDEREEEDDEKDGKDDEKDKQDKDFEDLSETEKAFYILTAEESQTNARLNTTMNFECDYYGSKITVDIAQEYTVIQKDGKYEEHNEMRIVTVAQGQSNVVVMTQGYRDGKMYASMMSDGIVSQSEITPMTQEEYLEQLEESLEGVPENFGINEDTSNDISCKQNKNGDWVASFSDLDKDGLVYFEMLAEEYFGSLLTTDIKDVTMVLTATEEFLPKTLEIEYEFSGTNPPTFNIIAEYELGDGIELPEVDWSIYNDSTDVPNPPSSEV